MSRRSVLAAILVLSAVQARAVMLPGGGSSPKKTDCHVEVMTNGLGFPAGKLFKGTTCADGDVCDADGARNGACMFTPLVCFNVTDAAFPQCSIAQVSSIRFNGKAGGSKLDTTGFDAAVAALGLPISTQTCSGPVDIVVGVGGPDSDGDLVKGKATLDAKAKTTKGTDKDKFVFVCLPSSGGAPPTTTTSMTTSTTVEGQTTTTTTLPLATPGA
ncbi:MAG: hypothetical protein ACREQL_07645, partial [Candidatus Binatia bacterium]